MSDVNNNPISSIFKINFDDEIKEVTKNDHVEKFSAEIILRDLINSGVKVYDAIDVLFKIKPFLYNQIPTEKIVKLLNQSLLELNYDPERIFLISYLQNIVVELPNNKDEILSVELLRNLVMENISDFIYTEDILTAIVNELYRILRTLRASKMKLDTIIKLIPRTVRNVVGLNPWDENRAKDDYGTVMKLVKNFEIFQILPDHEKISVLLDLFESIYRVILISFEYLPGSNINETFEQIDRLLTDLTKTNDKILSNKEIFLLGKSLKQVSHLYINQNLEIIYFDWANIIEVLGNTVNGLMNRGTISWIVVSDYTGAELYSTFGSKTNAKYKNLIGSAMSGIQTIVSELTDRNITEIQQNEGVILIEQRKNFSVLMLVNQSVNHLMKQKIQEFANFIEQNFQQQIDGFTGNVSIFYKQLDQYIKSKLVHMIN